MAPQRTEPELDLLQPLLCRHVTCLRTVAQKARFKSPIWVIHLRD
jgi:hypothetical protein